MDSQNLTSIPVIYVTGFGPFGSHLVNASQKIVEKLPSTNIESELNIKLHTEILDVAYESVLDKVPVQWNGLRPKLVVHIGVSEVASAVTLEKQATNGPYTLVDVKQCIPGSVECLQGFPVCLRTQFDLERTVREVERESANSCIKCILSVDPGKYLCSFVYYVSLAVSECRSLFIHVPKLEAVCEDHDLALARLVTTVSTVIKCLYRQLQEMEQTAEETTKIEEVLRAVKRQPRPVPRSSLEALSAAAILEITK